MTDEETLKKIIINAVDSRNYILLKKLVTSKNVNCIIHIETIRYSILDRAISNMCDISIIEWLLSG